MVLAALELVVDAVSGAIVIAAGLRSVVTTGRMLEAEAVVVDIKLTLFHVILLHAGMGWARTTGAP